MIHAHNTDSPFYTQALGWVYAHGELETFLGTDCVVTSGLETFVKYNQVTERQLKYSIHETFAINSLGEVKKVKCYLWYGKQSKIPRGLIVIADNEEDNLYAENQCRMESDHI